MIPSKKTALHLERWAQLKEAAVHSACSKSTVTQACQSRFTSLGPDCSSLEGHEAGTCGVRSLGASPGRDGVLD